jgi:hypothetical protein
MVFGHLTQKVSETPSQPVAERGVHPCHLSYMRSINRWVSKTLGSVPKVIKLKRTRSMAPVVEDLFSKCEALSSTPSTKKKKKN